jgi:hypothetical protein
MADRLEQAKSLISSYVGKPVTADLDGSLFEHEPATFVFDFTKDPKALWSSLKEDYEDYLEDWSIKQVVPVASVAAASAPDYTFAWIFLDWSVGGDTPRVLVTTTDRWQNDPDYTVPSLDALRLKAS